MLRTRSIRKTMDIECDGVLLTLGALPDIVDQSMCSALDGFVARGQCSAAHAH